MDAPALGGRGGRRGSRGRGRGRGRARGRGRGGRGSARGEAAEGGSGDWSCACGNFNYKFRDVCNKCKGPRDAAAAASAAAAAPVSSASIYVEGVAAAAAAAVPVSAAPVDAKHAELTKFKGGGEVKKTIAKPRGRGKGPRQRVKQLTQQIVQFAKRKRLGDAQRVFQQLKDEGLTPALLTFSTFINAHVASGDMIGAERVFQEMQVVGVAANSVIYNTLFKGYCVAGNTARTAALFEEMAKQDVIPDTNTVNAHLSGCLRAGDVGDAHGVFAKMAEDWAAEPDFFTYKRVVQMLSRGLRLDALEEISHKLEALAGRLGHEPADVVSQTAPQAALVWLHLHRGLSAALLGQWALAAGSLEQVKAAGAAAAVAPEVHLARSGADSQAPVLVVGEKGQHDFHLKVFQGEMSRLESFLESRRVSIAAPSGFGQVAAPDLQAFFCRTFIFGAHTNAQARKQLGLGSSQEADGAHQQTEELAVRLVRSLARTFGLDACVDLGMFTTSDMEKRFCRRVQAEQLCWRKIFKSPKHTRRTSEDAVKRKKGGDLPVKLEICSGFGEWVVAQAKAEAGAANWAALELRYDRCHSIFSRAVFEEVENLAVLGGDAFQILPNHIPPASVDHIFVNFPEPPQTNMTDGAESHFHLLTAEFFREMHRVLKEEGRLTILHDEYRYCCLLARTVAALNAAAREEHSAGSAAAGDGGLFRSVLGLRGKGKTKYQNEDIEGIRLYHGVPGKKSGHIVRSSSYFDQLWETKDRFFLVLAKQ